MIKISKLLCLCSLLIIGSSTNAEEYVLRHENVLGTSLELRFLTDEPNLVPEAEASILAEIDRLAAIFSSYDSNSELMRWQFNPSEIQPSQALLTVLERAEFWRQASGGAFDVRTEAYSQLWQRAEKVQKVPTSAELEQIRNQLVSPSWSLPTGSGSTSRSHALPVNLNALAKGFILDSVCELVEKDFANIDRFLVNIGGDLRSTGEGSFAITLANPFDRSESARPLLSLNRQNPIAMATSGGYHRHWKIEEKLYSHILDPRNGRPVEHVTSATVIAPTAMDADAAATICSVLTAKESLRLIESLEDFECFLLDADGNQTTSSGWPKTVAMAKRTLQTNEPTGLIVDFSLNRPEGGRYRRPYVAIWLEDKDGFPVKTAILWMMTESPGPRWHRDLTRWYRNDRMRKFVEKTELIGTISGATRGPGKYQARFDGTDNRGKPLSEGTYTLYIEVAREHGTYQIIRKDIKWGSEPIPKTPLEENVEVKEVTFEFHPLETATTKGQ
ncbi:Membrane-associated lipoprotein involved in thiamine biosynthesis [Planctomycetales bacterium 10988]|nr:Membrane-associated lipoprotein involved in thiamine biosynthesis [Planctomycetales bacterium 10988]